MGIYALIFIVLSVAIFLSVFFKKKIGLTIPVSIMFIIFIIYFFGIFNYLEFGANFTLILAVLLLFASIYSFVKSENRNIVVSNIFTPILFIWILFVVFFFFYYRGAVLSSWDEFSHWGDVVKQMFANGVLSSNEVSLSTFKAYPPGNSIFHYIAQYFNGTFNESFLFITQQLLCISFTFSFLEIGEKKNISKIIISSLLLFVFPSIFFDNFFNTIYVDALLGLVFGCGVLNIVFNDLNDKFNIITCVFYVAFLPLLKDAGLLFSIILIIIMSYRILSENEFRISKNTYKSYFPILIMIISIFISVSSWKVNLYLNNVPMNSQGAIDFFSLIKTLIGHDYSYRTDVVKNFLTALNTTPLMMGNTKNITLVIQLSFIIVFYVWILNNNKNKLLLPVFKIIFSFNFIYLLGLLLMYVYKFSEYEALNLASFPRYIAIYSLSFFCIPFIITIRNYILYTNNNSNWMCIIIIFMLSNWNQIPINFYEKRNTAIKMGEYKIVANEVIDKIPKGKYKINFVSTKSSGFDFWVMRFNL